MTTRCVTLALLLLFACSALSSAQEQWPRFRGAEGAGISSQTGLPIKWDASNVLWKTSLKGRGQSSPVYWDDRIFLTSALEDGKQRLVFCIDAKDGKMLWEQTAWTGTPEPSHERNGWASATCCTDGKFVYASFGKAGLHCFTVDGKHVWSRELGEFLSDTKRGTAASPILAGDLVILNGDSESDPFLFGIDKLTGKTVWKTGRPALEGYSTPALIEASGRKELVLNGEKFIAGYDPATGKLLWTCKSFAGRGEPVPAVSDDILYVINGQPGDVYAVRAGGSGDVTHTRMLWHTPRRGGRDGPSPIVLNHFLLVSNMAGIGSCYDAGNGKELWKQRLGGAISASPFAAEGRAYLLFENGETLVFDPGPTFKELARNTLGAPGNEIFRASPTPCHGHLLLRSDRTLYCVGANRTMSDGRSPLGEPARPRAVKT
jgi:outer membrane protein assembly factor BamB